MGQMPHLPNELLIAIAHDVQDSPSLRNMVLSSRLFQSITEPVLYREVEFEPALEDTHDPNWRLQSFIRTVWARPVLRSHVRRISLGWTEQSEPTNSNEGAGQAEGTAANSSPSMSTVENGRPLSPFPARSDPYTTKIFVLLYHLPRLEYLSLKDDPGMAIIAFVALLRPPTGFPEALRTLKEVHISHDDTAGGFDYPALIPFFWLRAVRSIQGYRFAGAGRVRFVDENDVGHVNVGGFNDLHTPTFQNPAGASTVTELSFECSAAETRLLADLLRLPKALNSFVYHCGGGSVGPAEFIASELAEGLRAQAHSLTQLEILTSAGARDMDDEAQASVLGSLRDFVKLERVKLSLTLLFGPPPKGNESENRIHSLVPLLPPSLAFLDIDLDEGWTVDAFLRAANMSPRWHEQRGDLLPNLKLLTLWIPEGGMPTVEMRTMWAQEGLIITQPSRAT